MPDTAGGKEGGEEVFGRVEGWNRSLLWPLSWHSPA